MSTPPSTDELIATVDKVFRYCRSGRTVFYDSKRQVISRELWFDEVIIMIAKERDKELAYNETRLRHEFLQRRG
jgi:hypothetical protein